MSQDLVIRMEHCREIGFCSRGVRAWMTSTGLDYMHFLQHGYKISEIEPIGDALSRQLIEHVREQNED